MPNPVTTIDVKDAYSATQTLNTIGSPGQLITAASRSVVPASDSPNWPVILQSGSNAIGTVVVTSLPSVVVSSLPSISLAGTNVGATPATQIVGGLDSSNVLQALPIKTSWPVDGDLAVPVRYAPEKKFRTTFAAAVASGVDTTFWTLIATGGGQTVAQTGGNLVITAGTTTNSETIIRSNISFTDSYVLQYTAILSQRNANNNFFIEMVDVLGDGLAVTAGTNTATVTLTGLTAANVGQSVFIGNLGGLAGAIPGRFAIASVTGSTVVLTATGWTGTASGTCSIFGMNFHQVLYTGATATNVSYDAARAGYATGYTVATINTTASPGHVGLLSCSDGRLTYADQLRASNTGLQSTIRGSRVENVPTHTQPLYVQIRSINGTVAPTATTFTMGSLSVEDFNLVPVAIADVKPLSADSALPVAIMGPTGSVVTANNQLAIDLIRINGQAVTTGGGNGILSVGGPAALAAAATGNPLVNGGVDATGLMRRQLYDAIGAAVHIGPGELFANFTFGTGAAAVTDGTNGKTFSVLPRDSEVYLNFTTVTSATAQLDCSWDGQLWYVIPMTRIDNTAVSQQYASLTAFTPVVGALYRGKTYGAPYLRPHAVAGTACVGSIRVVPLAEVAGQSVFAFSLDAANTTESAGVANGQMGSGGIRTFAIPVRGSAKAEIYLDAVLWTGTMSAGIQMVVEGNTDPAAAAAATTWQTLTLTNSAGGGTTTTYTGPATAYSVPAAAKWEVDVSNLAQIRVRMSNAGTGGTVPRLLGGVKVVPVAPSNNGSIVRSSHSITVSGLAATSALTPLAIEAAATKSVKLRKLTIQPGIATAATVGTITINRETTASSGGTAATNSTLTRDASDLFGGIVRTGAFTPGTNAATGTVFTFPVPTTYGQNIVIDLTNGGQEKPFVIPAGVANGITFVTSVFGAGAAGLAITADWTEE